MKFDKNIRQRLTDGYEGGGAGQIQDTDEAPPANTEQFATAEDKKDKKEKPDKGGDKKKKGNFQQLI